MDNEFYPSPKNDSPSATITPWNSGSMSGRENDQRFKPRAVSDNTSPSSQPTQGGPAWGLLARKQTPNKSNSDEFWAAAKRPERVRPRVPIEQGRDQAWSTTSWSAMEDKIRDKSQSTGTTSSDWGTEFDDPKYQKSLPPKPPVVEEIPEAVAPPKPEQLVDTKSQDQLEYTSRDRIRSRVTREDRLEIAEAEAQARAQARGGTSRNKRSGRNSRHGRDEDDEGGFDYDYYQEKRQEKARRKAQREAEMAGSIPIRLPELISITALAQALKVEPNRFLSQLGELGFEGVTLDSLMAGETAALVAQEYGFEPTVEVENRDLKPRPPPEDPSILPLRPPVVTIMGHVDHGKTTLLDYLRKSSIAAGEHGGITQRIGAFSVKMSSGKPITFLDTPGHAAFLAMRQRGAHVTDIVVLVVAADDSVMPQTIEAINHARTAKVPMIVAITKIDKDSTHIDQVKHDLATQKVDIEDFGGDVQVVCVSGKTGQGMDDLEENILALSEMLDHRAELDGPAEGWVLESSLKQIGKVATVLVKRGTLRPGDIIAANLTWAKIRNLRNEAGDEIDEALPGTPVEILGWKELPAAGDQIIQAADEGRAKDAVSYREGLREREQDAAAQEVISESRRIRQEKRDIEKAAAKAASKSSNKADAAAEAEPLPEEENGTKMINFVVKGDLHGSVEAVCASISEIGNNEVLPRILRSATGPITESDVDHAATTGSIIINFATTTPGYVKLQAEEKNVRIIDHNVIYHLVDEVKAELSKYLSATVSFKVLGEAEVLQIFPINYKGRKYKNVAGCRVRNGLLSKGDLYRVFRHGEMLYEGILYLLLFFPLYSFVSPPYTISLVHITILCKP